MDKLRPPFPARYRVEHHAEDLAPLILGLYLRERAARAAFQIMFTRHRVAGRSGWIVLIDQGANPEQELRRRPLPMPTAIN